MRRSRNSYIRAPRSVTLAPMGTPSRSLKFAIDSFAMVSALVDRFAAALADTELASVGEHLDAAAHRLVAPAADDQHVGERQRAFALDDTALTQLLRRPLVLLHHVELLDQHPPGDRQHAQHFTALAPLLAGDHRDRVSASHVNLTH